MTDTILPFDSEDEMKYAFSKQADPKVISSYWEDELNDDGQVQRFPQRSVGTEDLSDWAQAVAAAMITPAEDPSKMFGIQGAACLSLEQYLQRHLQAYAWACEKGLGFAWRTLFWEFKTAFMSFGIQA